MNRPSLRQLVAFLLFALFGFALSGWAQADPPSRVARLSYISGSISFSPGGENDWVRAIVNRPLITGDRLWADAAARAELQLGGAAVRLGANTSVSLLNLDDRVAQLQLAQGTLNIRVRALDHDHIFEVDTPNLAYVIRRPGNYRVHVDPDGTSTLVTVRFGQAEVFGEGRAFVIDEGSSYRFYGRDLRDYETFALGPTDEFDRWAADRDRRWERSVSARYVSRDLIGYEDLDEFGSWRYVEGYGNVWMPTRVAADWAPYRDGHWAWVEPWGWTWIDDAPWGFAPSHYGRWARFGSSWGWVPGPVAARPVYAPALVAFVGGSNFKVSISVGNVGAIAWFPLGPREVYRPSYAVSREYFTSVNTSNTSVSSTNITNVYSATNVTNVTYVNQQVPGAVIAVPTTAFTESKPVAKEAVRVSKETVASTPVVAIAPIAPAHASVLGAAATAPSSKPPEAVITRAVVAKAAPPPAPVSFAAKQTALAANAGKPLDTAAVAALKPAAPAPAPAVKVVTAAAPPVALPAKPASAAAASAPAPATATAQVPAASKPAETVTARPGAASAARPVETAKAPPPPASVAAPRNVPRPPSADERAARAPAPAPSPPEATKPSAQAAAPASPAASPPARATARAPAAVAPAPAPAPTAQTGTPSESKPVETAKAPSPTASAPAPRNVPRPPSADERAARAAPAAAPSPAEAPRPSPQAAAMAASPPGAVAKPPPQAATPESRGPRGRPEAARASDKREAASDAKKGEEQRKRGEEEAGRRP
ncbi:MAG: hypothetical protein E6H65_02995 [Betaproteobacteria bacterium]|nr:MAG: hypothetical protein E6H65_02995 [Betaproteobacteria bacterium]